jgi:hypothetical protein
MDPLRIAFQLYFSSGRAAKVTADLIFGVLSLLRLFIWPKGFDFCLRTSTHFWTTSTDEVAWPQGRTKDFLGVHIEGVLCPVVLQLQDEVAAQVGQRRKTHSPWKGC